jgi:hypothetical protein
MIHLVAAAAFAVAWLCTLLPFLPGAYERLNRARGYYASGDAAHPHWKYFWFD